MCAAGIARTCCALVNTFRARIAKGAAGNVSAAAGQIADFTANFQLLLGALETARGSARDTPQAPTSAALARGVGFVRHVLPQSFQNPSKRSDPRVVRNFDDFPEELVRLLLARAYRSRKVVVLCAERCKNELPWPACGQGLI
jgi:hypothetical protein